MQTVVLLNNASKGINKRLFQHIILHCKANSKCKGTWGALFKTANHRRRVEHYTAIDLHLYWLYAKAFPKWKNLRVRSTGSNLLMDLDYPHKIEFIIIIDY